MSKIYIHLGAHKSASTTLQKNLRLNTDILSQRHNLAYYASKEIHTSDLGLHFRQLSRSLLNEKKDLSCSQEKAKREVDRLVGLSSGKDLFLSWEGFLGHSSLDKYKGIYTHSLQVAQSLKTIFSEYEVECLLVVRRQDSFLESCYLQQIKENRSLSFDEFTAEINVDRLSWLDVVLNFEKVFGNNIAVCPFEYIKKSGAKGFIEYCMSALMDIDFDASSFELVEQANASFSMEGVSLSRELLPQISSKRRSEFNRILFSEFSSKTGTKAKFFSEFEKNLILNKEAAANSRLFNEFFVHQVHDRTFDLSDVSNYWNLN